MAFIRQYLQLRIAVVLRCALLLLGAQSVFAFGTKQEEFLRKLHEPWRWAKFTTESGLPSNTVYAVHESKDSTLWAVTSGGIAWYDGYRWIAVPYKGALPDQLSTEVQENSRGELLIQVRWEYILGGKSGFRTVISGDQEKHAIFFNNDDLLLDAYQDTGRQTDIISKSGVKRLDLPFTIYNRSTLRRCFVHPSPATILAVGEHAVYRLKSGRWGVFIPYASGSPQFGDVAENPSGDGVASISQPLSIRGLWEWHAGGAPNVNRFERGDWIESMDISDDGMVIAVDKAHNFYSRIDGEWNSVVPLPMEMSSAGCVLFTRAGKIIVGGIHGLNIFDPISPRWLPSVPGPTDRGRVHEIFPARDGSLWLGTADGLEIRKPDGTSTFTRSINGTPIPDITGIGEDDHGNIWISSGASFDGAFCWNGSSWRHEPFDARAPALRIHRIRKDRRGRLWFLCMGTNYSGYLQPGAYYLEDGVIHHVGTDEGLKGMRVYDFAEGPDGALWFGTLSHLNRLKDGKWTYWECDKDFMSFKVFSLAVDSTNTVWCSNWSNAVCRVFPDGTVEQVRDPDGWLESQAGGLAVDSTGTVWIGSSHGVLAYKNGSWLKFDERSGLSCTNVWPVVPWNNSILVGTLGMGLSILKPSDCDTGQVSVEFDEPVVENDKVYLRWRPVSHGGIPSPDEIESQYSISRDTPGAEWSVWSTTHAVTFRGLEPGDYHVSVRCRNLYVMNPRQAAFVRFKIYPPFYLRVEFIAPIALAVLALIFLGAGYIVRGRQFRRELEARQDRLSALALELSRAQEDERRSVAAYLHDELNQALGYCKMKLGLMTKTPEPEELISLHGIVSDLYDKARSKTFDLSPHVLYELGLAEAIRALTERLEEQHRIAIIFDDEGTAPELGDDVNLILYRAVQELLVNVTKHAQASSAHITLAGTPGLATLVVEDDGLGIAPPGNGNGKGGSAGFGLFNLRERIQSIGGTTIVSNTGAGTRVELRVPAGSPSATIEGEHG